MKYVIYAGIALAVGYNILSGDMSDSLGMSIPSVSGIWSSIGQMF